MERRKQSEAGSGRPRDRKCSKTGTVMWELGQGGVWKSKGYVFLPFTHYLILLSPLWLLERPGTPLNQIHPPNSSLVETTSSPPPPPPLWPQQGCPCIPSLHLI